MNAITLQYKSSVLVAAGWRSVVITARCLKISEKRAEVIDVIDVDGHGCSGYASRTGANRQKFDVDYVAKNEEGKIKIISKCTVIEE